MQATKRGHHSWRSVEVVYREGGRTHTLVQNLGIAVCAPATVNYATPYDRLP
jgi:hypothetical protein